jgi:uncharacterized protein DUF5666/Calx-beta domain-containing protein
MRRLPLLRLFTVSVVLFTAACGKDSSPVSPSSAPVSQNALAAKGGNSGNGSGNPHDSSGSNKPEDKGKPDQSGKDGNSGKKDDGSGSDSTPTTPGSSKTVQLEGLISGIAGDTITVNAQVVAVPLTAIIRHGSRALTFAELQVGDRVHVKATLLGDALEAGEVNLQNPAGNGDPEDSEEDPTSSATVASVRVGVIDAAAAENGEDTGTFRLTRTPTAALPVTSPLTVTFTLTGTATNGLDYQLLPLSATFPAGSTTVDIVVTPLADLLVEAPETVVLTLTGATPYVLGTPLSAVVTITEMPTVSVSAFDSSASETGLKTGQFRFTRNGSVVAPLTVTFAVGGTALAGSDYQSLPASVTFVAGAATADVLVTPILDGLVEGPETVIVTVTGAASYDVGVPASATVTIVD